MARWRLINAHYLNVPRLPDGTDVEYVKEETNRDSGRVNRKRFTVPMLLDPENPGDVNSSEGVVVCHEGKGEPRDYVFEGKPTPDMEPLDEEAEAISAEMREKWDHPIDSLPANGGMNEREMQFMEQMMASFAKQIGASLPNTSVPSADVAELKKMVEEQAKQIEALRAGQVPAPPSAPTPSVERRV